MRITIHAKRLRISQRKRELIEARVRRIFRRQQAQVAHCAVSIAPVVERDNVARICRLRLWSPRFGSIVVRAAGDTTRTAVQQAALRAREIVRRRLHKRLARARRWPAGTFN
jgi:hypothetical protein